MQSRILFGIITAALLIGVSYFTSKIYSTGFRFNGVNSKASFLAFLMVPLLFAASIIMTRSASWGIGPTLYSIIQVIAGFGFYIFLGAILLAVIFLIAFFAKISLPISVTWIVFSLSIAVAVTGLIQSRIIRTVEYTITLPNLPAAWNGKTAALVSDTHFGLVNYTHFSDKVVSKIISLKPDIVLHAGDFYDGPQVETPAISESWKNLTATIPVFYAPGNHEGYGNYRQFVDSVRDGGATVLEDKITNYNGLQIAGITYHDGKDSPEAAATIRAFDLDPKLPSILINHPPTSLAAARDAGFSLMVSGHTHNGQFWPNNYLVHKIYGPQAYGLHDFGTLRTLTTSGVGTFGPPFRTFNSPEIVLIHFKSE